MSSYNQPTNVSTNETPLFHPQMEKPEELDHPTTVDVVVNSKSNKKIKAILPKDHHRNIHGRHTSTQAKGQLVVYDPKKAKKKVCHLPITNTEAEDEKESKFSDYGRLRFR